MPFTFPPSARNTSAGAWLEARLSLYSRALSPLQDTPSISPFRPCDLVEFLSQASSTVQNLLIPHSASLHPWWQAFCLDACGTIEHAKSSTDIDLLQLIERNLFCARMVLFMRPAVTPFHFWIEALIGSDLGGVAGTDRGVISLREKIMKVREDNKAAFEKVFNHTDFPPPPVDQASNLAQTGALDDPIVRIMSSISDGCALWLALNENSIYLFQNRGLSNISLTDMQAIGLMLSVFDTFYWVLDGNANGQAGRGFAGVVGDLADVQIDRSVLLYTFTTFPDPSLIMSSP